MTATAERLLFAIEVTLLGILAALLGASVIAVGLAAIGVTLTLTTLVRPAAR